MAKNDKEWCFEWKNDLAELNQWLIWSFDLGGSGFFLNIWWNEIRKTWMKIEGVERWNQNDLKLWFGWILNDLKGEIILIWSFDLNEVWMIWKMKSYWFEALIWLKLEWFESWNQIDLKLWFGWSWMIWRVKSDWFEALIWMKIQWF